MNAIANVRFTRKGIYYGKETFFFRTIAQAAGAGAAALATKNRQEKIVEKAEVKKTTSDYRNTERGMNQKNSKGIYYTNGNYEAFARPRSRKA